MDVLERVREVNAGASLTEERLSGARARLLEGIDAAAASSRKRAGRRPMLLIAGAVAGVAAVTATVVVINQPSAAPPRIEAVPIPTVETREPGQTIPKPDPTAGTVVTPPFPGTTPQAGQYLRVERVTERLHYRDSANEVSSWGWTMQSGSSPISALLARDREEQYVPADRTGDWYQTHGPTAERVQLFPGGQEPDEQAAWDQRMPMDAQITGSWSTGGLAGDSFPLTGSMEYYENLPRDPQALLEYLRQRIANWASTQAEADDALLEDMTFTLTSNIAPPDVREAYIGAFASSGLARVDESVDGTVSFEVRREQYNSRTETVLVDESTGWVTEHTVRYDRGDRASEDMVPSGVPDIRTTYTVSIVNSIP